MASPVEDKLVKDMREIPRKSFLKLVIDDSA
jgi:hypothetical protein